MNLEDQMKAMLDAQLKASRALHRAAIACFVSAVLLSAAAIFKLWQTAVGG